jgi:cellulose/xylan binding protein with CBM9 domain
MIGFTQHNLYGCRAVLLLLAAVVVSFGLPASTYATTADSASVSYTVQRATASIAVDGRLDEDDWQACESLELVGYNEGVLLKQPTQCRLLWDDTFLYISWHCTDTDIWSTMIVRDEPLYNEEVVEVFINPDGDRETYLELEVNPLGALWDGFILSSGGSRHGILAWNSSVLKRGVWLEGTLNDPGDSDGFWSVELAVPLAELRTAPHIPPRNGDSWRINLYRIDMPGRDQELAEYGAWSPVSGDSYHDPDRFGRIIFSSELVR